jgi:archaeal flagellar protein FlaJ
MKFEFDEIIKITKNRVNITKLNWIKKNSFLDGFLKKKSNMREKEFLKHKFESLKLSVFIGLFGWLVIGLFEKNIFRSFAFATIFSTIIFVIILQVPLAKKKKDTKKFEAGLPFFLLNLSTEIMTGKSFSHALKDSCKEEDFVTKEFLVVFEDTEKGLSFEEALNKMNKKFDSLTVKRALSNLSNIHRHGKKDVVSIKKLAQELLMKQRIESKEFSSKMVMYSLVFIAVSAIVPAMFQSFILIGSYFMALSFTAEQVFIIIVVLFPIIDVGILMMINNKTPEFLKN